MTHIHKSFNSHKAVNGVSFSVDKGEIFGLLGPNGAGKPTMIRILSTVPQPDRGDFAIGGAGNNRSWRIQRGILRHRLDTGPHQRYLAK